MEVVSFYHRSCLLLQRSAIAATRGQVLPSPATTAGPDSFDARVERAWRFMRNMFFTPEEHAAVAEAVVRLMAGKYKIESNHNE